MADDLAQLYEHHRRTWEDVWVRALDLALGRDGNPTDQPDHEPPAPDALTTGAPSCG